MEETESAGAKSVERGKIKRKECRSDEEVQGCVAHARGCRAQRPGLRAHAPHMDAVQKNEAASFDASADNITAVAHLGGAWAHMYRA